MRHSVPDWVTLTDDEEIHWFGGPSVAPLARKLVGPTVLALVGIVLVVAQPESVLGVSLSELPFLSRGLTIVGLVLLGIGVAIGMLAYLRHSSIGYVLTSEELYVKRGLVSRDVTNVRLERVQDTGFTQSGLERLLGYGDVTVSTAGSSGIELRFRNVDDPATVNNRISEQVDRARERSEHRRDEPDRREERDSRGGRAGDGRRTGTGSDDRPVRDDRDARDDRPRRDERDGREY